MQFQDLVLWGQIHKTLWQHKSFFEKSWALDIQCEYNRRVGGKPRGVHHPYIADNGINSLDMMAESGRVDSMHVQGMGFPAENGKWLLSQESLFVDMLPK